MGKKKPSKRQQQVRQGKATKRKQKKQSQRRQVTASSPRSILRQAGSWPLHECLVTKEWQRPGEIVQVLVARHSPTGQVACGVFLVDLGCLGIKNALVRLFDSTRAYQELRRQVRESQPMKKVDLNLAAKIIHEAIAYAQGLGFSPHRDYREAMPLLGDADADACETAIPSGIEGKPFFVAGPYDDVPYIMAKLKQAVGPDGFHYLVHLTEDDELFEEEEE